MHIYGGLASPFVQRALLAARAKGHELECRMPPGGGMQSDEFRDISPMGRVPVLALDGGAHVSESSAIAAYLDEALPGPALLPADLVARASMRELEAVAALEYAAGMRPIMVARLFGRPTPEPVVEAAFAQAGKGAEVLDRILGETAGAYAVGDGITLADCILAPVLNLALVVAPVAGTGELVAGRPRLADYMARMADDRVVGRSLSEMREGFARMLRPKEG